MLNWLNRYTLIVLEEIDSTNSEACRIAKSKVQGNYVILSKRQLSGRGTKKRKWCSLEGNVHTSILIQTHFDIKKNLQLPFLVANVVFETIYHFAKEHSIQLNIQLKWPNDVLINNKKVAGILLESLLTHNKSYIIIGIGVNIEEVPNIDAAVTCTKEWGICIESPSYFLYILMTKFDTMYNQWIVDNNFVVTRQNWIRHAYNLNKPITVDDGCSKISGVFKDISLDGTLRLEVNSGEYCNIFAGEVLL